MPSTSLPTDGYVNNRRGDLPFGEVGTVSYHSANNYSLVGRCKVEGYSGQCFQANDEIKGDVARAYFYMTTCYERPPHMGWHKLLLLLQQHHLSSPHRLVFLQMLMQWSERDPVDEGGAGAQRGRGSAAEEPQSVHRLYPVWSSTSGARSRQTHSTTPCSRATLPLPCVSLTSRRQVASLLGTDREYQSHDRPRATVYYTSGLANYKEHRLNCTHHRIEETTTLVFPAAKDDAVSHVAVATYVIKGGEQPAEGECIWSRRLRRRGNKVPVEQVQNAKAIYYGDDGQYCAVYDKNMAGGEAPELLIPKKSRPVNTSRLLSP